MRSTTSALLCACLAIAGCGPWDTSLPLPHVPDGGEADAGIPVMIDATNCVACHRPAWQGSTRPPHPINRFGEGCVECHASIESWATIDYKGAHAAFPLVGEHQPLACTSCHGPMGVQGGCVSCHRDDYDGAKKLDHVGGGLPLDCARCHMATAWSPAKFDHAFLGATPCANCHLPDWQGAKLPDHAGLGLPKTCQTCHVTTAWKPATFDHAFVGNTPCASCHLPDWQAAKAPDHAANAFDKACQQCHTTKAWKPAMVDHMRLGNTPCITCHQDDFVMAAAPPHKGFPQDCRACHTTTAWKPWTVNHAAKFPIAGKHAGLKNNCAGCHPVAGDFKQFSCTGACHTRAHMDDKHAGFVGYSYDDSGTCFRCHPDGTKP